MDLDKEIVKGQGQVQSYLEDYFLSLSKNDRFYGQKKLIDAMKYSVLNGGKRFRALLVYWSGKVFNVPIEVLNPIAAALEVVHAFSLIHDDLPSMDNDELRRGLPTCHIKFDEATAILAGDALCSEAFSILSSIIDQDEYLKDTRIKPINIINGIKYFAKSIGPVGMVAGQSMDVNNIDINTIENLKQMHRFKTGKLIEASILLPLVIIGLDKSNDNIFNFMESFAVNLGVAFQIKDDLLDKTGSTKSLGKKVSKDSDLNKVTYPDLLGINQCIAELENCTKTAIHSINKANLIYKNDSIQVLILLAKWNSIREN